MPRPILSADELAICRGCIQEAIRGDGVVCLECGLLCWRLGKHLGVHGLGVAAYRAKWGYPPDTPLALPIPLEARRRAPLRVPPRRAVSPGELQHYRAHIREAMQEGGVVCLECGGVYQFIGSHVRAHGITGAAYREKWGYNRGSGLVSPTLHQRKRHIALARNFGAMSPPGSYRKAQAVQLRGRSRFRTEARLNKADRNRARYAAGWRPSERRKVPEEILKGLVAEELDFRAIAARVRRHPEYIRARLRALGLVKVRRPLAVPDAELLALRRAGLWNPEIARRLGCSVPAVNARLQKLRRQGVPVPTPPGPRPNAARRVSDEALLALVRQGLRPAAIAARLGLRDSRVSRRLAALRRRGLLPPAPPRARSRTPPAAP
ncbi:MAG TPA: MucR family transcriptional regulator [Candidatus Sulfotelmatobacter sp.]|nr:MucR family transcriptional regulator [Candidatus Sulfotelmatobacter sp.]